MKKLLGRQKGRKLSGVSLFEDLLVQLLEISRRDGIRLSHELHGRRGAGDGTNPAADAPLKIDHGEITLHLDDLNRADLNALATSRAPVAVRLPNEIGRHQDISGDLFPSDRPDGPAATAAAVAGMLDAFPGIVHHVHEACLLRLPEDIESFLSADLFADPFFDQVFGKLIVLDAVLERVITPFLSDQLGRCPAGTMGQGDHMDLSNQFFHHLKGEYGTALGS